MKALFLFVLICLASLQSFADCAGSGIWVYPSTTTTLTETPVIVIEGYYRDQEMIRNAGKKYTLYLESDNELVRLIPVEILEGEMELTQILLKPVRALRADTEYELIAKSITKSFTASTERLDLGIPISVWTVKAINDKTAPTFTSKPKWTNSTVVYFGCGPANSMEFACETAETGSCMVRTRVKNTEDDTKTTYYLHVGAGVISVGHGMCSGAFIPKTGVKYELEFSLLDASWNEGETATCTLVYNPENMH